MYKRTETFTRIYRYNFSGRDSSNVPDPEITGYPGKRTGKKREIIGRWGIVFAFSLHEIPLGERSVLAGVPRSLPLSSSPKNSKIRLKGRIRAQSLFSPSFSFRVPRSVSFLFLHLSLFPFCLIEVKGTSPARGTGIRDFEVKERATRFPT